ncbi:hypothetical protein M758_12G123900 [Ceratodon purpureus]|nr:hypothetical protein M758_12G123900 [Ceratodon purpureus]
MKNRRSGWRYSNEERRDSGREWRVRSSNQRGEPAVQHRHNPLREERRDERATGWGGTERIDYAPSSTAPSNRPVDIKETEAKCDDGWGASPVDDNVSADLTSAWEALATTNLSDWSKPPQIESVEHWDDTGAKETWDFITAGRSPVNNPDLYLEKNIDWNSRIPPDLLAFVDNRCRHRMASPPRSGSPVLLGLETLVHNLGDAQPQLNDNVVNSKENLEQGGGSGSWGDSKPGQRRTKQQVNERVSGEKHSTLMRDDYKDRGRKRRGDRDEYHRKPRFRTAHRYVRLCESIELKNMLLDLPAKESLLRNADFSTDFEACFYVEMVQMLKLVFNHIELLHLHVLFLCLCVLVLFADSFKVGKCSYDIVAAYR